MSMESRFLKSHLSFIFKVLKKFDSVRIVSANVKKNIKSDYNIMKIMTYVFDDRIQLYSVDGCEIFY